MKSICSRPTAYCLLPTAYGSGAWHLGKSRIQYSGVRMKGICSRPTAYCIRFLVGGLAGVLPRTGSRVRIRDWRGRVVQVAFLLKRPDNLCDPTQDNLT